MLKKLVFILLFIFLTSCSKNSNGDIIINVSSRWATDVPDEVYYRKKVEEFNKLDNGITVVMDNIATESDYLDKLRVSFANNDAPNVFIEYGGSRVLDYVEAGALVNIKPYYDEDSEWYSSFYTTMFKDLQFEGYDGIWGVPFKTYTILIYYNKDIFQKYGITTPETFNELIAICKKLKDVGVKPFQVGEKDVWRFGHFHNNVVIKSLGVNAAERLANRTLSYDSIDMIKTYKIISDMVSKGYFGDDILNVDYGMEKSVFSTEGCAMRWDGSWYISEVFGQDIYDKMGVIPFPYIDEKYKNHAQGGASDMWFVSKLNKSKEEIDASIEFVKFITSVDYYKGLNEVATMLHPVKFEPTLNTPSNPLVDELVKIFASYEAVSTDIQNIDMESHMIDTVRNALQGLAMGISPEQCGKQIVDRINK